MMRISIIPLLTLLLLCSCGGRRNVNGAGSADGADSLVSNGITYPFTVDVSVDYPMEPVSFQEVLGELEYVALETTPECLIADTPGLENPVATDNDIFIRSGVDVFRFGRDGKFRNRIGHEGRGPGEYLSALEMCVNAKTEEVFVYDILSKGILVYGYDGRHKRTLRTNSNTSIDGMTPITDSTLLIANIQSRDHITVDALQLISSRDGSLIRTVLPPLKEPNAHVPIPAEVSPPQSGMNSYTSYPVTVYYDPAVSDKLTGVGVSFQWNERYGRLTGGLNIYASEAGVMMMDFMMDTVYVVSGAGELAPRWVKSPPTSGVDIPKRYYSKLGLETEKLAFFYSLHGDVDRSGHNNRFACKVDKSTGAVTRTYLYDANIDATETPQNRIVIPTGVNTGRLSMPYQPLDLLKLLEAGKLSGELATLATTLKDDDNPVLAIQKNQ